MTGNDDQTQENHTLYLFLAHQNSITINLKTEVQQIPGYPYILGIQLISSQLRGCHCCCGEPVCGLLRSGSFSSSSGEALSAACDALRPGTDGRRQQHSVQHLQEQEDQAQSIRHHFQGK